jgi:hypothetical protein
MSRGKAGRSRPTFKVALNHKQKAPFKDMCLQFIGKIAPLAMKNVRGSRNDRKEGMKVSCSVDERRGCRRDTFVVRFMSDLCTCRRSDPGQRTKPRPIERALTVLLPAFDARRSAAKSSSENSPTSLVPGTLDWVFADTGPTDGLPS